MLKIPRRHLYGQLSVTPSEMCAFWEILRYANANNSNTDHTKDIWKPYYSFYRQGRSIGFRIFYVFIHFDDFNTNLYTKHAYMKISCFYRYLEYVEF